MEGSNKRRPRRTERQLPPGKNVQGRGFVVANQRERLLDAVADIASLAGYGAMSIEQICGTAGVSRRTFYDMFGGKDDVFIAALDGVIAELSQLVRDAYDANGTFAGGVRDCLAAFLRFVNEQPRLADLLLIETAAAGPAAVERRHEMLRQFAEMLRDGGERLLGGPQPPILTAETIVGGIYEVVYSRVIAGEAAELPALLSDLAYSMLQPYVGDEAARREAALPPSALNVSR
jgi:AcrR family transcriptional regulator